jgi:hypothetical protein
MIRKPCLLITLPVIALLAPEIRGHFLFIKVGPLAEGGRSAEVYFSEFAEAGDPRYISKVAAGTTLRIQTKAGQLEPLAASTARDRLRAVVPATGPMTVYADCVYGVLPRKTPFLLRHFAKGIAGTPDEINALEPLVGTPLEIAPRVVDDGKAIRLTACKDRQPIPSAQFTTVDADLVSTTIKADETGMITWTPPAPGRYTLIISQNSPVKGEHNGATYEEIRDFATVAFDWPLVREGSDPEAVSLFEQAVANRAQWGSDFPGFTAEISGVLDGREFAGSLTVDAQGSVAVKSDDETAVPWLTDQLESLVMHRMPPRSAERRPSLRFADADEIHPLGRLLIQDGGRMASSYRVKDGQITSVNRNVGELLMTITPLDHERSHDGRSLPSSYVVQYWKASTGALERTETVRDRWVRLDKWDLPAEHIVTTSSASGFSTRSIVLTDHKPIEDTKSPSSP